jgi:hypothetical protein
VQQHCAFSHRRRAAKHDTVFLQFTSVALQLKHAKLEQNGPAVGLTTQVELEQRGEQNTRMIAELRDKLFTRWCLTWDLHTRA